MHHSERFVASPTTIIASLNQGAVLLDLRQGAFLGLNSSATAFWRLLVDEQNSLEQTALQLATQYHLPVERVLVDLKQWVATLTQQGILFPASQPIPPSEQCAWHGSDDLPLSGILAWCEAWWTLKRVHHFLQCHHMLPLSHHIATLPAQKAAPSRHRVVLRLAHIIRTAASWQPYRAACLHQSLALWWMLRRRRMRADLVIGVYTYPFSGHAWVTSDDHLLFWDAGMLQYPDETFLQAMTIIFHSGEIHT